MVPHVENWHRLEGVQKIAREFIASFSWKVLIGNGSRVRIILPSRQQASNELGEICSGQLQLLKKFA